MRELREETGLEGRCGDFVGWVERIDDDDHFVILDFRVSSPGRRRPGDGGDAAEARPGCRSPRSPPADLVDGWPSSSPTTGPPTIA